MTLLKRKKVPSIIIVSVVLLFLTSVFSSRRVKAIEYGGIGGRPAYPREDNPRSESIFIHTTDPGNTIKEGIQVINNSQGEKTLLVYAADSTPSTDGGFACEQLAQSRDKVGKWIDLDPTEVTLEAGSNEVLDFDIKIPDNAGPGEHNGCILIQEVKDEEKKKSGINLSTRTGLRVALTILGDIYKKLESGEISLRLKSFNIVAISYSVKNLGNVSIDGDVSIKVENPFGKLVEEYGGNYAILANDTSQFNFDFRSPFWGGIYKVSASTTYDKNTQNELGASTNQSLETVYSESKFMVAPPTKPAIAIYSVAVLLILFLIIWQFKFFIFKKKVKSDWETYLTQPGEDLKSIAKTIGISWKSLAKANELKPPYQLKSNTKLKVPSTEQLKNKTQDKEQDPDQEDKEGISSLI